MNERESFFVVEIERAIKNSHFTLSNGALETFQKFLTESTNTYFQAYSDSNFEKLEQLLREQRSLRKTLTNELRNYSDQSIVLYTKMVQTYNIFNKLAQSAENRSDFKEKITLAERRFRDARSVLVYLYRHAHVQHKELVDNLGVRPSTLSDLLSELVDIDCVEKIESGRCSFYNLTNDGRKYLKEIHPDIDQEYNVERNYFYTAVWENIKEKQKADNMLMPMNSQKRKFVTDSIKENKWKCEESLYAIVG